MTDAWIVRVIGLTDTWIAKATVLNESLTVVQIGIIRKVSGLSAQHVAAANLIFKLTRVRSLSDLGCSTTGKPDLAILYAIFR